MFELNKHAYLIIAHKNDLLFKTLIKMLDDERNDIFVHMDVKNKNYRCEDISSLVVHSKVYHCNRIDVTWGGYSQIKTELLLLKEATKIGKYKYYHLLSGQDLPIKTQDEIHKFFDENSGKEFVAFSSEDFKYRYRINRYYFFQEMIGRKSNNVLLNKLNGLSFKVQDKIKINRNFNLNSRAGSNWFSITDDLARYVIRSEKWIKKTFKYTLCCDEVFLQTLIINSDFKNKVYHSGGENCNSNMRLIDWNRGNPYVFRTSDFYEIVNSNNLFCRKFDEDIDNDIVKKINELLSC